MKPAFALAAFLVAPLGALAAPSTWVHPTDPACGGHSPCYSNIAAAVTNVDNGGTVTVLANMADNILSTQGKTGVTVKGNTPSITLTGGVNVASGVTTGWTIRDLIFTAGFGITDLATSLTVQNVTTTGMTLGQFSQDTNAAIDIQNVTMPGGIGAVISILASPGWDIGGSITIANCIGLYAVNVNTNVATGNPASLTANISISGNQLSNGGNIVVQGNGTIGTGNISGAVSVTNNTMSPLVGKFGLTIWNTASGNITGPVTFTGNTGAWLAVLTSDSTIGGSIGQITATNNDVEAIEIEAKGGALAGPIDVNANNVINKGGGTGGAPYILVQGAPITGTTTVRNTTGAAAQINVASVTSNLTGAVTMSGNSASRMTLDSQGGSITQPFSLTNNTMPAGVSPASTFTIRTLAAGNIVGGTLSGSTFDTLQFDVAGGLTGALAITGNVFRTAANLLASGGSVGPGVNTMTGNDFRGTTYLQRFNSVINFNRQVGALTNTTTAPVGTVDAKKNWWRCNTGPGTGCGTTNVGPPNYTPWLKFSSTATCATTFEVWKR